MEKCIFLDRDGNINVEVDYLHKPEDFRFEKNADKAIKIFNDMGYKVIVITNQSGVARGYYTEEDVVKLHEYMDGLLKDIGAKVDAYYYCPHHPEKGIGKYKTDCKCRKPELGMFLQAKEEFDVDFENSMIVGDKLSDVEAGLRLGMKSILVRTGHGKKEEQKVYFNCFIYDSLYDFALELQNRMK